MMTLTLSASKHQQLEATCKTTADRRLRKRCQAILMADRRRQPYQTHSVAFSGDALSPS
jgi:hypothetical protein